MPTPWQRDLDRDRENFTQWLETRLPEARNLAVSELTTPQSSGFSNDTLLCSIEYEQDGDAVRKPVVVRIQPTGYRVFPEYDMGLQYRTMEKLADTDVPVPPVLWLEEEDDDVLGAAFYVMGQVQGRVPTDNPPYHAGGWMTEATPEERNEIWMAGFECMAKIHRLDWEALGFGFLDKPELGDTALDQQIAYYKNYLSWAARGKEQPVVESALEWIEKNKPDDARRTLSWGDSRIGNIIYDGTRPAAVIDWEMVTLGSPEQDVAWQIFIDRHHSEGIEHARLEGMAEYDETLAYYSKLSGFSIDHLHFYQVFAGFRFGVIMIRLAQQMGEYAVMPAEAALEFETNNTVTRLLAKVLGVSAPGEGRTDFGG